MITSPKKKLGKKQKIIEIFYFTDPLCYKCWKIEPLLNKLLLEYGEYISIKYIMYSNINNLNLIKSKKQLIFKNNANKENDLKKIIDKPHNVFLALKTAEFYGNKRFLLFRKKLQEALFVYQLDISNTNIFMKFAKEITNDPRDFFKIFNNLNTKRLLRKDMDVCKSMYVNDFPSFVFFNTQIVDDGLKITGAYSYDVYEQLLIERANIPLIKLELPSIENLVTQKQITSTYELCQLYNMEETEISQYMTNLFIHDKVIKIPTKYGDFWRLYQ